MQKSLSGFKVENESEGRVTAVFATLNVIDKDGDVTIPGAFEDGAPVKISAYNHGSWGGSLPVGKGTIREVGSEAILEGQFFLNTSLGRDTFEVVKELGDMGEWSYGFDIAKWSRGMFQEKEVRFLEKLNTFEVSPVLRGAGVDTRTLAAKSEGLKLTDHIESVNTEIEVLVKRASDVLTLRADQGKRLGQDAKSGLERLIAQVDLLRAKLAADSDPNDNDQEMAEQLAREAARFELSRL